MTQTTLHIDASARTKASVTRDLSARVVARLGGKVIRRDLAQALPQISENWIDANFTPADQRDTVQRDLLALSDALVAELQAADTIVIGAPIYNFGVPSSLKAWIDLVCRVGLTFKYSAEGPKGLLEGKRAVIVIASGGTPVGSDIDYATDYLRHVMGFIGITEVEVIAAERIAADADAAIAHARAEVDALAA